MKPPFVGMYCCSSKRNTGRPLLAARQSNMYLLLFVCLSWFYATVHCRLRHYTKLPWREIKTKNGLQALIKAKQRKEASGKSVRPARPLQLFSQHSSTTPGQQGHNQKWAVGPHKSKATQRSKWQVCKSDPSELRCEHPQFKAQAEGGGAGKTTRAKARRKKNA